MFDSIKNYFRFHLRVKIELLKADPGGKDTNLFLTSLELDQEIEELSSKLPEFYLHSFSSPNTYVTCFRYPPPQNCVTIRNNDKILATIVSNSTDPRL